MLPSNPRTKRVPKKKQKISDDTPQSSQESTENLTPQPSNPTASSAPKPPRTKKEPPNPLNKMQFEELFYNRNTQMSAFDLFVNQKNESVKNGFSPQGRLRPQLPGDSMKLRSSDPPPLVKENPVHGGSPKPGSSGGANANLPEGPIDQAKRAGRAMVHEIMDRYASNKVRERQAGGKSKKTDAEKSGDDFVFDESELLWENSIEDNSKSDFLKYTIPQWDIKVKLCKKHYGTIENMTPSEVATACMEQIPELKKIMDGEIPCERHEIFKTSGLNKGPLRDLTVAAPFSSAQDYRVMTVINDVLLADQDQTQFNGELMHYVSHVLLPEALVRIYAAANGIPIDLAEKELRYEAGYDGLLPEEIIRTVSPETQVNKENII